MATLFKILIATIIITSCAISFMSFDLASLSISLDGNLVKFVHENDLAVGIVGGILLLGIIATRKMPNEHVS